MYNKFSLNKKENLTEHAIHLFLIPRINPIQTKFYREGNSEGKNEEYKSSKIQKM